MSKKTEKVVNLTELEAFARRIGSKLVGGEIIELRGDLGSGKTTFVSSLVKGSGSSDKVSSPTFVIKKLYKTDKFDIHHFDFYRLQSNDLIALELEEVASNKHSVIVIEWPDIVENALPSKRLKIDLSYVDELNKRLVEINCPKELEYLIK